MKGCYTCVIGIFLLVNLQVVEGMKSASEKVLFDVGKCHVDL